MFWRLITGLPRSQQESVGRSSIGVLPYLLVELERLSSRPFNSRSFGLGTSVDSSACANCKTPRARSPIPSGLLWAPVIFYIRSRFRRRTDAKSDGFEAMFLVECASGMVFLVRMQFNSLRRERLRELDEACAPASVPLAWIDVQAVEIRPVHCQVGDDLRIERANPDCTVGPNNVVKDHARMLERERLPGRQVGIGGEPCAMPDRSGCGLIFILKGTN